MIDIPKIEIRSIDRSYRRMNGARQMPPIPHPDESPRTDQILI